MKIYLIGWLYDDGNGVGMHVSPATSDYREAQALALQLASEGVGQAEIADVSQTPREFNGFDIGLVGIRAVTNTLRKS